MSSLITPAELKQFLRITPIGAQATGEILLSGVTAGRAVSVANNVFTADTDFTVGDDDAETAAALLVALEASSAVARTVLCAVLGDTITLTAIVSGVSGNAIDLSSDDAEFILTPFSGGTGESTELSAIDDAELARACLAASDFVRSYVGWDVGSSLYSEDYTWPVTVWPHSYTKCITLRQPKVTDVSTVFLNGVLVPDSVDGGAGWRIRNSRLELVDWCNLGGIPTGYEHVLSVTYTAGYESLPADLRSAILETAGDAFRRHNRLGQRSWSNSAGGTETYYIDDILPSVRGVLESYSLPEKELL